MKWTNKNIVWVERAWWNDASKKRAKEWYVSIGRHKEAGKFVGTHGCNELFTSYKDAVSSANFIRSVLENLWLHGVFSWSEEFKSVCLFSKKTGRHEVFWKKVKYV